MKLFYSSTSPYSRKVRMAIQFKDLDKQIDQIVCNPFTDEPGDTHQNPLGKVPTLILNDGTTIFDSPVICEYLDRLTENNRLYPEPINEWISVKTTEALCDGILDAAYNIVMESRRSDAEKSSIAIETWHSEIKRSLEAVEKIITALTEEVTQSHISIYSTLGYLDFRLPDDARRDKYANTIYKWFADFTDTYKFVKESDPF